MTGNFGQSRRFDATSAAAAGMIFPAEFLVRRERAAAARLFDLFRARHCVTAHQSRESFAGRRVATVLRPGMKKFFLMTLLLTPPVSAQSDQPAPPAPLTTREQVQADRARAAAEEKSAPTARPWDRGADGKRPWERGATAK